MSRRRVEYLIVAYVDSLESAANDAGPQPYQAHLHAAETLLARWRGGESPDTLAGALKVERMLYESEVLPGPEAEDVGRAFGDLCRAVGAF